MTRVQDLTWSGYLLFVSKSESYSRELTRVLPACFFPIHMHPRKILHRLRASQNCSKQNIPNHEVLIIELLKRKMNLIGIWSDYPCSKVFLGYHILRIPLVWKWFRFIHVPLICSGVTYLPTFTLVRFQTTSYWERYCPNTICNVSCPRFRAIRYRICITNLDLSQT